MAVPRCARCLFFFQAEDGIRDWSVTGVQTCALPIYDQNAILQAVRAAVQAGLGGADIKTESVATTIAGSRTSNHTISLPASVEKQLGQVLPFELETRSEERRVGQESRVAWWTEY